MSVTLAHRVPAEYVGKARVLRDAIAAEDKPGADAMGAMTGLIRARIKRGHAVPRADTLASIADAWRRHMPPRGRLALEIDLNPRRKSLAIRDLRLTASQFRPEEWATIELGVIINLIRFEAAPFHYKFDIHTLAHVSLHAIARRLQRGEGTGEAAVLDDLRALGVAVHALGDRADGAEFLVPASGGSWRGTVETMQDVKQQCPDKSLLVRTFLADES